MQINLWHLYATMLLAAVLIGGLGSAIASKETPDCTLSAAQGYIAGMHGTTTLWRASMKGDERRKGAK